MSSGKIWPYAIGISIALIFVAGIVTIVVASKLPVEKSDTYMMGYHEADANANEIIEARIAFNKKYKIQLEDSELAGEPIVKYKITDLNDNPVNNAKLKVIFTRPNSRKFDIELNEFTVENGVYIVKSSKLPLEGRWDIMAKIDVDNLHRFYNFKADTRNKEVKEY